ncbi:MAG: GNAT family N-acetyltransferase [Alphaproteobacteria bacterium]
MSNSFTIIEKETEGEDWELIGGALTEYTATRPNQPPTYAPLNKTFNVVAENGENIAGAVITRNQGMCEVDLLIVKSEERGKGVGATLLSHIEEFAKAHGDVSVRLSTPTWQGEGFYEKCGYSEMGRVSLWPDAQGKPQHQITYYKELGTPGEPA